MATGWLRSNAHVVTWRLGGCTFPGRYPPTLSSLGSRHLGQLDSGCGFRASPTWRSFTPAFSFERNANSNSAQCAYD
jgi:hypothetical protein